MDSKNKSSQKIICRMTGFYSTRLKRKFFSFYHGYGKTEVIALQNASKRIIKSFMEKHNKGEITIVGVKEIKIFKEELEKHLIPEITKMVLSYLNPLYEFV